MEWDHFSRFQCLAVDLALGNWTQYDRFGRGFSTVVSTVFTTPKTVSAVAVSRRFLSLPYQHSTIHAEHVITVVEKTMPESAVAELHERLKHLIAEGETLAGSFNQWHGKKRFWRFMRDAVESLWLLEDRLPSAVREMNSLPWTTILPEEEASGSSKNAYRAPHQTATLTDFDYSTFQRAVELLRMAELKMRMETESQRSESELVISAGVSHTTPPKVPGLEVPDSAPELTALLAGNAPLKEQTVSKLLGVQVSTLQRWRLLDKGPRFHKIGRAVRYLPQDVRAYLEGHRSSETNRR
jgi:hypothetical protein